MSHETQEDPHLRWRWSPAVLPDRGANPGGAVGAEHPRHFAPGSRGADHLREEPLLSREDGHSGIVPVLTPDLEDTGCIHLCAIHPGLTHLG